MALQHIQANFNLPEISSFIVQPEFSLILCPGANKFFIDNFLYSFKGDLRQILGKNPSLRMKKSLFLFFYQLFWTQACPEEMCTNGTQVPREVPSLPNPQPVKVGHTAGVDDPYSFRIVMWLLLSLTRTNQ